MNGLASPIEDEMLQKKRKEEGTYVEAILFRGQRCDHLTRAQRGQKTIIIRKPSTVGRARVTSLPPLVYVSV